MSNTDTNDDQALDQAILARDAKRESYILDRLRTRRKMAMIAFGQFVFGGAAVVITGLLMPDMASRIDHMGAFLSIYFTSLAGVVSMYWGLGAYERSTYESGAGFTRFSTSAAYAPPPPSNQPMNHPPLVKHPHAAG